MQYRWVLVLLLLVLATPSTPLPASHTRRQPVEVGARTKQRGYVDTWYRDENGNGRMENANYQVEGVVKRLARAFHVAQEEDDDPLGKFKDAVDDGGGVTGSGGVCNGLKDPASPCDGEFVASFCATTPDYQKLCPAKCDTCNKGVNAVSTVSQHPPHSTRLHVLSSHTKVCSINFKHNML